MLPSYYLNENTFLITYNSVLVFKFSSLIKMEISIVYIIIDFYAFQKRSIKYVYFKVNLF